MNCQKIICLVLLSFCLLVTRQGVAFQFDAPQPPNVENAPLPPIPTAFYGDVSPVMPASEATVLGEGRSDPTAVVASSKQLCQKRFPRPISLSFSTTILSICAMIAMAVGFSAMS